MAESRFEFRSVWPWNSCSGLGDTATCVSCSLCCWLATGPCKSQMRPCTWEPFEKRLALCRCEVARLTFSMTLNCLGDITNNHVGGFQCGSSVCVPCGMSLWYDEVIRTLHQKRHGSWWLNPDWISERICLCPRLYSHREFVSTTAHIF